MNKHFAIVVSQFNAEVTEKLRDGALSHFDAQGVPRENIKVIEVPGAIEIPLVAQLLAKQQKYSAIICLGAIIRGDTDHYHYVCEQVSQGCQRVMLDHDLPVLFGILTTDTEEQALERCGGVMGHKGKDCVDAALVMVEILKNI